MELVKFNERLIAFDLNSDMVNATDMLKSFPHKRMNDFLRLGQTKELIAAIEKNVINPVSVENSCLQVVKGNFNGKTQGTWMCRLLAYDFAAWLSVDFKLFIYNTFDTAMRVQLAERNEKIYNQQRELDYFWDQSDRNDLYKR